MRIAGNGIHARDSCALRLSACPSSHLVLGWFGRADRSSAGKEPST
jgi:hypothetical protein